MRRRLATIAICVAASGHPAWSQEGSWGDGHAAAYNTPMGYKTQAEFNGQPKGRRPRDKTRAPEIQSGFTSDCINGASSRPPEDETHGQLRYPCPGGVSATIKDAGLSGTVLTVVTTGAGDTTIVESTRHQTGSPSTSLNGGLNLD